MTIERLMYDISEFAIKNNLVNASYAGPSIYEVNGGTVRDYPYLFTSPTDDITVGENTTQYGLTLYYVDRLLTDGGNEVDVFSNGVETLKNIIRQLEYLDEIVDVTENPTIRLFTETQRMADSCAGAYCRLTVTALNAAACPVYFDETGAPIGTYIPAAIKDQSVLVNLASKNWVVNYINEHYPSGSTDVKVIERLIHEALEEYTKTQDFATINGSGITDGEAYELLEKAVFEEFQLEYRQTVSALTEAISAVTPEGYEELKQQVSGNSEDISELSGITYAIGADISELSGFTASAITALDEAVDGVESGLTALDGAIGVLSAATEGIGSNLGVLSGFTAQAVSSITLDISALSGATSAAFSGLSSDLAQLSATTSGIAVDLATLSGLTDIVLVWDDVTAMTNEQRTALVSTLSATPVTRNIYIRATDIVVPLTERNSGNLTFNGYFKGNAYRRYVLNTNGTYGSQGYSVYTLPSTVVSSSTVNTIWSGSLADYQTLGTYSNDTLYLII